MMHPSMKKGMAAKLLKEAPGAATRSALYKLEVVLKCDSIGSVEAVTAAIGQIETPDVDIAIIHSGVGSVSKSDVLLAGTGSRLIIGFQTGVMPGLDKELREHNVEVRLYNVIYALIEDVKEIARSMTSPAPEEEIIGSAKVIALFKSERKGIIIGCEVLEGSLALGRHFRVISAMGPVYTGTIESLHIEDRAVQKAVPGQQVGIKIRGFDKAKIGDLVESFRPPSQKKAPSWHPVGGIIRK